LKHYGKKLELFSSDMIDFSTDSVTVRFVYQSKSNFLLSALIGSKANGLSFEEICQNVNSNICSRSTIQKVLKTGETLGVFTKKINSNDRRIQQYNLSDEAEKFFEDWVTRQTQIFCTKK
tara:strand:- start:326 stop:685 length:360 start_codon:yes stop_codon:yes gene_type:complete